MKSRKILIAVIVVIIILLIIGGVFGYIKILKPYNEAVKNYKKVLSNIDSKNNELDNKIKMINDLIDSGEKVIDENVITTAKEVTKKAESNKYIIAKMPLKTKDIIEKTEEMKEAPDYTDTFKELDNSYSQYETNIKQYKQFINPSKEFVIKRLQTIDEITDARAVTEDNDPNGNLNKPGGYTATIYFESKNVNQSQLFETDLIKKGTEAGGAIEVYANEEDAKKREEYLATFDGGIFASGSHKVVGTTLIRTSDKLSASKQNELENKIINALRELQ